MSKMISWRAVVVGGLLAVVAPTSHALTSYVRLSLASLELSIEGVEEYAAAPLAGLVTLGFQLQGNFAFEFRGGVNVGEDGSNIVEGNNAPRKVDTELDNLLGVYLRGGVQAGENFYPYILLGVTDIEFKHSIDTMSRDFIGFPENASSYGIGADIKISESTAINIEYTQYFNESDLVMNNGQTGEGTWKVAGVSVGFNWSF